MHAEQRRTTPSNIFASHRTILPFQYSLSSLLYCTFSLNLTCFTPFEVLSSQSKVSHSNDIHCNPLPHWIGLHYPACTFGFVLPLPLPCLTKLSPVSLT